MGTLQIIDGYTLAYNPEKLTIPESKKTVSEVKTYSGSAIFQWPALIQGQFISMFWTVIPESMYVQLRSLYLSSDTVAWNDQKTGVYQVIITDLKGKYIDGVLDNNPNRIDVELKLNIRSGPV